jgi:hypothetical protein
VQGLSGAALTTFRSTKIGLDTLLDTEKYKHIVRKCKIVCTLGPKCSSEEMLGKLLDAGMNIARNGSARMIHMPVLPSESTFAHCKHSVAASECLCADSTFLMVPMIRIWRF